MSGEAMVEAEVQQDTEETQIVQLENEEPSRKKKTRVRRRRTGNEEAGDGGRVQEAEKSAGRVSVAACRAEARAAALVRKAMAVAAAERAAAAAATSPEGAAEALQGAVDALAAAQRGTSDLLAAAAQERLEAQEILTPVITAQPALKAVTRVKVFLIAVVLALIIAHAVI